MTTLLNIWRQFKRICIHKFWVLYYCWSAGLFWQGIVHDLSKFSWIEFWRSVKYFDPKKSAIANERSIEGYSRAFLHHRGHNPHHYEYWITNLDQGGVPVKMPWKYAMELVCDYLAACRTYGGDPTQEIFWWEQQEGSLKIHPGTKEFINYVFSAINYGFSLSVISKVFNKSWYETLIKKEGSGD